MLSNLPEIAAQFGTPCFVYHLDEIVERAASIRHHFRNRFLLSYAVKCNPNIGLLDRLCRVADLFDISSGGELARLQSIGYDPAQVSFTGPAKTNAELLAAVATKTCQVVLESVDEAERLSAMAQASGHRHPVLIRIAPLKVPTGFGSRMGGKPSQFGIDEEEIDAAIARITAMPNLDLQGFHLYAGTQCLSADAVTENLLSTAGLFERVCATHGIAPVKLIFGSGFGIPYTEQDQSLDLARIAEPVGLHLDALRQKQQFARTAFVLELGRYLVGEAGIYLTRIVSAKCSRGTEIRLCDGGMNHHLGAAGHLGSVIRRNYRMFKVDAESHTADSLTAYDLYGPLCTSIDSLAQAIKLPPLKVGDVIGIHCSGAYGPTASPMQFISHDPPREVLVETIEGKRVFHDISPPR